jgi:hypothetical protein
VAELIAPLPRAMLAPGMTIAFEAIDPDTGAAVTGVIVSNAAIYTEAADLNESDTSPPTVTVPDVSPRWAPLPLDAS